MNFIITKKKIQHYKKNFLSVTRTILFLLKSNLKITIQNRFQHSSKVPIIKKLRISYQKISFKISIQLKIKVSFLTAIFKTDSRFLYSFIAKSELHHWNSDLKTSIFIIFFLLLEYLFHYEWLLPLHFWFHHIL